MTYLPVGVPLCVITVEGADGRRTLARARSTSHSPPWRPSRRPWRACRSRPCSRTCQTASPPRSRRRFARSRAGGAARRRGAAGHGHDLGLGGRARPVATTDHDPDAEREQHCPERHQRLQRTRPVPRFGSPPPAPAARLESERSLEVDTRRRQPVSAVQAVALVGRERRVTLGAVGGCRETCS